MTLTLHIDGHPVTVPPGATILDAARRLGLDIPTLCYLEQCGPLNSCQVCLVKTEGKLVPSCATKARDGMIVESETAEVHAARRTALELLFSDHVGDCLAPCHRLCPLGLNIPVLLRQVQANQLDAASVTVRETLPLPAVLGRLCHHPCEQGCRRGAWSREEGPRAEGRGPREGRSSKSEVRSSETASGSDIGPPPEVSDFGLRTSDFYPVPNGPANIRDTERFVADWGLEQTIEQGDKMAAAPPATGKSVAIIGAGPAGLAAAHYLLLQGHACTIADRHPAAGGGLRREVEAKNLPAEVLDAEIRRLEALGARFQLGVVFGTDLTLDGLLRGFDSVLVATGEISKIEGESFGLEMVPGGIRVQADTFETSRRGVFAAGSVVKPIRHLVRAMAEGRSAAQRIHQFVSGQPVRPPPKPFSSIMGRMDKTELQRFVQAAATILHPNLPQSDSARRGNADLRSAVSQTSSLPVSGQGPRSEPQADAHAVEGPATGPESTLGTQAGIPRRGMDFALRPSSCLHCDCRSSGHCALQRYARIYEADASRFRQTRREFERQYQPGGVIFEPGKCILCGICVKLAEQAAEPLGLSFVGRGFNVRVAAPFHQPISEGLRKVAADCVRHCPTGALAFNDLLPR